MVTVASATADAAVSADALTVAGRRPLRGRLRVPGDKSISHRALLLAALAEGTSRVSGLSDGDDVVRTRTAIQSLGALVEGDSITGGRGRLGEPAAVVDVGNSGTCIRLLAGVCAGLPGFTVLQGDRSIARRPMDRIVEPLRRMGASIDGRSDGSYPPLGIRGGHLVGIDYDLPVASAQVKSAVLLAGLDADGETIVRAPAPSRAHTEEMLLAAGADLVVADGGAVALRPSELRPFDLDVPGDPSAAAFWIVAALLAPESDVTVERIYVGPARAGFLDVLARMGADLEITRHDATTADVRARTSHLVGTEVGGAEVPGLIDEVPALALAAAAATGTTTFRDAAELRVKESDRIATTTAMLAALGARTEGRADGLVVHGGGLRAGTVDSGGDHRIAMAAAVAGATVEGLTTVLGWGAVATSYPGFAAQLERLSPGADESPEGGGEHSPERRGAEHT